MELRTRKMWASALLTAAVMALASGSALAQGMEPGELKRITDGSAGVQITDPGELKARMESFSIGIRTVTDPGEVKALTESFAYEVPEVRALEPGELKALMEDGTEPVSVDGVTTPVDADGFDWTGAGLVALILVFAAGVALVIDRRRHDPVAPA
jgi:hypothetical protein